MLEHDQLAHALLLHGPVGSGRRLLALSIICRLLDMPATDAAAIAPGLLLDEESVPRHPDFAVVQPPPDKRLIPAVRVRELIGFLNLTSHQSGYKVVLLNPAHAMSHHAANSLLKTLEEPPGRSVLVLVTDSISRLAPTIVSRCHRVRVPLPTRDEALAWLKLRDAAVDWTGLLDLAGSAPIRALEYRRADIPAQIEAFARDIDALELRRASPASIAKRWSRVDPEVCLTWLYQRISAEVRTSAVSAAVESPPNPVSDDLQNGAENLTIERAFAELRHIGELTRLLGSGLNADLQLSGILTRWYGRRATG